MTLAFIVTTLIIVASPGTGVVYTLAAGLSRGPRAAIAAAFACTLGIVPHLAAAMMGLATVLHASAVAFETLKFAGVAYLLFMAWQTLRQSGAMKLEADATRPSIGRVLRDGIVLNLLNPKLSIFFVAFLPQFVDAHAANPLTQMLLLSGFFMLATFVIFAGYGMFAGMMRSKVLGSPSVMMWLRRSFAAAFGLLAIRLAFAER